MWCDLSDFGNLATVPYGAHRLSCLRVSDFATSTLYNSHEFGNFDFFAELLKLTFGGLSIALGLVPFFFGPKTPHYVHVLTTLKRRGGDEKVATVY